MGRVAGRRGGPRAVDQVGGAGRWLVGMSALALAVAAAVVSPAAASPGDARAVALERRLGEAVEVEAHEETGRVRFVGTEPGEPIAAPRALHRPAPPKRSSTTTRRRSASATRRVSFG